MDCGHAVCRCQVSEGQTFCSDYCDQATKQPQAQEGMGHVCGCGHPACQAM